MASTSTISTSRVTAQPDTGAEKFFQWSLYLMLVTGFIALVGTGKLDFLSLALGGSALGLRGYHLLKGRSSNMAERWAGFLTLLYFLFYLIDYYFLSRSFVSATVHLVLFIMVIKIYSVQRDRDLMYLAVLAFLMLLAAAVLTVDTVYLVTFFCFTLAAMATFVSMEMRRSHREGMVTVMTPQSERRFYRTMAGACLMLAALTMAGAAGIFFILPRISMGGGYLRNLGTQNDFVTGFSGGVNLGGIGRIQQSDAVVMHVEVQHGTLPADVRWRGTAFTSFDGQRWLSAASDSEILLPLANVPVDFRTLKINGAMLYTDGQRRKRISRLQYRVFMEPIGTPIFFLADLPLRVNGPYSDIAVTAQGTAYNAENARAIGVYEGESDTADPMPLVHDSNSSDYPPGMLVTYLQLPHLDPRIHELAQEVTGDATSNYERARAVETYLRRTLAYTLELPAALPKDPLANFLFERKKGHCEYFASSMAMMLRTLGIPTRVVSGFRGAEFNDVSGTFIVRARDAHLWVEVYFPEYGWVAFDPTPSVPAESRRDFWSRMGLYADAAREMWRAWIINYDFSRQAHLSNEISTRTSSAQGKVRSWYLRNYRSLLRRMTRLYETRRVSAGNAIAGFTLLLAVLALPFAPQAWRAWQRGRILRKPQRAPRTAAGYWYTRMLKTMERRGIRKSPAQTPKEFAAAIPDPATQRDVVVFTEHYERARFAGSVEDAEQLPQLYEEIAERT